MAKVKITLSLDRSLVGAVDEAVRHETAESRSAAVEEALRQWQLEQKRQQLERDVEAYYRSQTAKERGEDRAWSRLASRHVKPMWED